MLSVLWSPNAVRAEVELTRPATVVVNQNHESSWNTNTGRLVPFRGAVAVQLGAGRQTVMVHHLAKGLGRGALLSLLGLALSALALWRLTPARVEWLREQGNRLLKAPPRGG